MSLDKVTTNCQIDELESNSTNNKSEDNSINSNPTHSSPIPAPDQAKAISCPEKSQSLIRQVDASDKTEAASNKDVNNQSDQTASEAETSYPEADQTREIAYGNTNNGSDAKSLLGDASNKMDDIKNKDDDNHLDQHDFEADILCSESNLPLTTNTTPLLPETKSPEELPDSQSSQLSTADVVKSALDTLHSDQRVQVESYESHCSVEVDVEQCLDHGQESEIEGIVPDIEHEEECVIEDLLTPLEESLSLPSSSEGLVVDENVKKGDKKGKKSKSKKKSCTS